MKRDPERTFLPFKLWPDDESQPFKAARSHGSLFEESGRAVGLSEDTLRLWAEARGRWLNFLRYNDPAALELPFVRRMTSPRLIAFIERLKQQGIASRTQVTYVGNLYWSQVAMAPEEDWSWMRKILNGLLSRVEPKRDIEAQLVATDVACLAGCRAMQQAEADANLRPICRAIRYRDGLMLAIESVIAVRLRNFWSLHLGHQIFRSDDRYWIDLKRSETKTGRPHRKPLPRSLTRFIDRYLNVHRPALLRSKSQTSAFWISRFGRPLGRAGVTKSYARVTTKRLKKTLRTHSARYGLAVTIVHRAPRKARAIASLLGHSKEQTAEGYAKWGRQSLVSSQFADMVEELQRAAEAAASTDRSARRRRS